MRFLLFILLILTGGMYADAQKETKLRPKWIGNPPKTVNPSFYFVEVHSDASSSLQGARTSVLQELTANVERTDKVTVKEVFEDNSTQQYHNDQTTFRSTDKYQLSLQVEGSARPICSRRIDEYWTYTQRGGSPVVDYHAVYAVERNGGHADFSPISTTTFYAGHGLWRSAIVPGWGQFYKGSYLKGGLILGGTVALAAGIIYTNSMRSDYANKIAKTHITENKRTYATKRDNFTTGRNICIGGLAALYVYNLVDAIVAPGARRIIVHKSSDGRRNYSFEPTVLEYGSPGLAAAMTF